jgi:hypothetical protein
MKIAAIATALLAVVGSPLSASAATYDFVVTVVWETDDNATPTNAEKAWAATNLKTAYKAVHDANGEFDMTDSSLDDFDLEPNSSSIGNRLRGGDISVGQTYHASLIGTGGIYCTPCVNWDDDDSPHRGMITSGMDAPTVLHKRWEETFCDQLKQSRDIFNSIHSCTITTSQWNYEFDAILNRVEDAILDRVEEDSE